MTSFASYIYNLHLYTRQPTAYSSNLQRDHVRQHRLGQHAECEAEEGGQRRVVEPPVLEVVLLAVEIPNNAYQGFATIAIGGSGVLIKVCVVQAYQINKYYSASYAASNTSTTVLLRSKPVASPYHCPIGRAFVISIQCRCASKSPNIGGAPRPE
jgi:hypothetical protein